MAILADAFLRCPSLLLPLWTEAGETNLPKHCWFGIVNTISMKVNRDGTYGPLVSGTLIMVRCYITHSGLDPALWQAALSSCCPPCEGAGWRRAPRAECILKSVCMCTCACARKVFPSLGLDLRAKGGDGWAKALGIIWKRGSPHQILVSISETKLIFFLVLNESCTTRAQTVFANHGEKKI